MTGFDDYFPIAEDTFTPYLNMLEQHAADTLRGVLPSTTLGALAALMAENQRRGLPLGDSRYPQGRLAHIMDASGLGASKIEQDLAILKAEGWVTPDADPNKAFLVIPSWLILPDSRR